jgi:myo-inositol-1(or 4)-monophosphatase
MQLPRHDPIQLSAEELKRLMHVANLAADAAALVSLQYFRQPITVHNKAAEGDFDPVTVADREAELAIRRVLQEQTPKIGIFGEEHETIQGESGLMWIVDPIDGTRSFMSGMPLWGTLIGLYDGQESVLGLVDQPALNERYSAYRDSAYLALPDSTHSIATRRQVQLADAVAYCTTPDIFTKYTGRPQFESVRDTVKLMRYGGDCYAFALLASGHIDVVIDCDLQPYDIAALIPIIRAAGGVVTTWTGDNPIVGGHIAASGSRELHDSLLEHLAQGV